VGTLLFAQRSRLGGNCSDHRLTVATDVRQPHPGSPQQVESLEAHDDVTVITSGNYIYILPTSLHKVDRAPTKLSAPDSIPRSRRICSYRNPALANKLALPFFARNQVCSGLMTMVTSSEKMRPQTGPHYDIYRRLLRARRFIDQHYSMPLDLDRISAEACLSRYHFLRLFKQAFNRTPHRYLTERRIQRAKELLAAGNLTVTDICFEVGFESLGSFSSLFHKYVGRTPIDYRSRMNDCKRVPEKQVPGCFIAMWGMSQSGRPQL
jgi:AraC-like DNA-binding protein